MEVLAIVAFCAMLFMFMKVIGLLFGARVGSFAGVGCLGMIILALSMVLVIVLGPILFHLVIIIGILWVICRILVVVQGKNEPVAPA